jgi:hypothetical protein
VSQCLVALASSREYRGALGEIVEDHVVRLAAKALATADRRRLPDIGYSRRRFPARRRNSRKAASLIWSRRYTECGGIAAVNKRRWLPRVSAAFKLQRSNGSSASATYVGFSCGRRVNTDVERSLGHIYGRASNCRSHRDAALPSLLCGGLTIDMATGERNDVVDRTGIAFVGFNDNGRHSRTHAVRDLLYEV